MNMHSSIHPGKAALAEQPTSAQYLTFEVDSELFAIPILAVKEIRGCETAAQIPRTEAHILGIINLRGTIVPILDVRKRLGIPPREMTATTVVIVVQIETGGGFTATVGCVVDAVSDVTDIAVASIRATPDACGSLDTHYIHGVAEADSRLVLLLDLPRLIEERISTGAAA
jgi:purine-binding chemotaxis protein CheW